MGLDGADDSAVYQLTDELAVINTVDFFTPIVDDPYQFGAIAAANALSDVYAMGGEVLLALNVCAFPKTFSPDIMADILQGGADKVLEGGGIIAGGHTVVDPEPKYGLAVTGLVHPQRLFRVTGAAPGDRILLTKPLGVGLVTTALKGGAADPAHVDKAIAVMSGLNKAAARLFQDANVCTCTDITGFALVGHALDICQQSNVGLRFRFHKLPLLDGVTDYARDSLFPGGTCTNQAAYAAEVDFARGVKETDGLILLTPETSGGLLAVVPSEKTPDVLQAFAAEGLPVWEVGEVVAGKGITVLP